MINEILSFGYVPAVVLTGYWLISNPLNEGLQELRWSGKLGLSVTLGIIAWFPLLFACAWFNVFSPHWIGSAGWIASLGIASHFHSKKRFAQIRVTFGTDLAITAFAIGMFAFNGAFTSESILGGRDQGVYSAHGAHIAQTGMLRSEPPYERLYDPENFAIAGATNPNGYAYDIANGDMYIQFPPTFALHLAQFFGIGNYEALLLFNPVIASVSILTFFGLAGLFMRTRWALAATGFFALNVSQVWNARITLSEIISQNIILAGLAIAVISYRKQSRIGYCVGCIIATCCAFARVDGFLIPSLIAVTNACLFILSDREQCDLGTLRRATIGALLTSVVAYQFNSITSPGYFGDFSSKVAILLSIAFIALLAMFLPRDWRFLDKFSSFVRSSLFIRLTITGLVLLAIYAYFIRPYIEPFAEFENKHYGTRNFRENSLGDLSQYVSIVSIVFALVGSCFAIKTIERNSNLEIAIPFIPWIGYTLIYLYDPQISTDHIWRIRRFTPLAIPGLVLFSFWAIATIVERLENRNIRKFLFVASTFWFSAFAINSLRPIAFLKQYAGSLEVIREISKAIPNGALTLANVSSEILAPLQLAEGHKMIREPLDSTEPSKIVQRIIETEFENGRDIYFLSQQAGNDDNVLLHIGEWKHYIPVLDRTNSPPATATHIQRRNLYLNKLIGKLSEVAIDQSYFAFGVAKARNVKETGIYDQESSNSIPFRWTNGDASFLIKSRLTRKPIALAFSWNSTKSTGSNLKIIVNDSIVFDDSLETSNGSLSIPIENAPFRPENTNIRIVSDKWIPKDLNDSSQDIRELGIAITGISLFFDDTIRIGDTTFGNLPIRGISESGLHSTALYKGKWTRWTNGHARFSFDLKENLKPEYLYLTIEGRIPTDRNLTVKWNGMEVHRSSLNVETSTVAVSLGDIDSSKKHVELEVITEPIVPAEIGLNEDVRKLGVRIHEIRLSSLPQSK